MKRWVRAIGVVVFLAACPESLAAAPQSTRQPKLPKVKDLTIAQADLKAYQSLLWRYCGGDTTAIDSLLALDREALLDGVTVINTNLDDTRPWPFGDVKCAVLMHTDAVLRLLRQPGNEDALLLQLDAAGRVLVRGADPFSDREDSEVLKRRSEVRAFASRWYVAISRLLRDRTRFNAAHVLLGWGRQRVPDDAALLHESGVMEEFIATHPAEKLPGDLAAHVGGYFADSIVDKLQRQHGQQLANAEAWLRQSLVSTPSRVDTRLHLGRVLMVLGKDDDAVRLFGEIGAAATGSTYLAAVFRGAIEERRGAIPAAIDAYQRAATVLPGMQSAAVALSQVLQRQGRGEESRAILEELLAQSSSAPDPWWTYFFEPSDAVFKRVDALFRDIDE